MKRRWKRTTFKQLLDEMRPLSPIVGMMEQGILPIQPWNNSWGQWPSGPNTWKDWNTVQDDTVKPGHADYPKLGGYGYVLKAIPPGLPPPMPSNPPMSGGFGFPMKMISMPNSQWMRDQFYKAMIEKMKLHVQAETLAHLAKMESKLFQDDKDFHAADIVAPLKNTFSSAATLSYKDWKTLDHLEITKFDQVISSLLLGFHSVFPRARAYRPRGICEHCDDRRLWGLGTMLTYYGHICEGCVKFAFDRGIILQRMVGRSRSFVCKRLVE